MATIVGDVLGLQQRHHPKNIPHLIKKIKGFPLKVKSFRNSATCQKLQGGLPSPPPQLNHDGGMNLRVRPRVNCDKAVSCAKKKKKEKRKETSRHYRAGRKHSSCLLYLSTQLNDASFDSW